MFVKKPRKTADRIAHSAAAGIQKPAKLSIIWLKNNSLGEYSKDNKNIQVVNHPKITCKIRTHQINTFSKSSGTKLALHG